MSKNTNISKAVAKLAFNVELPHMVPSRDSALYDKSVSDKITEEGRKAMVTLRKHMNAAYLNGGIRQGDVIIPGGLSTSGKSLVQAINIEQVKFDLFMKDFKSGQFKGQRLGQAFINHFALDHIPQVKTTNLWEKDHDEAWKLIHVLVEFT